MALRLIDNGDGLFLLPVRCFQRFFNAVIQDHPHRLIFRDFFDGYFRGLFGLIFLETQDPMFGVLKSSLS